MPKPFSPPGTPLRFAADRPFRVAGVPAHLDICKVRGKDLHSHHAALFDPLRRDLDGGKEAVVTQHLRRAVAHFAQAGDRLVGIGHA